MHPRVIWLIDRVQAGLPVLAAAGLAGFTWWLVQSSPKDTGPARPRTVSDAPDYVLSQARVARFDAQGRIVAVLDGHEMLHRPDSDVLEIDRVQLSARDAQGRGLLATALNGVADPNAKVVTLQGQAHVTAWPALGGTAQQLPAPLVFEGEDLHIDNQRKTVVSTQPVTLTRTGSRLGGSALRYDHATATTDLDGRVKGLFTAGPVTAARPAPAVSGATAVPPPVAAP